MFIFLFIIFLIITAIYLLMQEPQFGVLPGGKRLERIKASPNYRDGQFQNLSVTPQLTGDASYLKVMRKFFFGKSKRSVPASAVPSRKTDLFALDPAADVLVWFGHSSYYMQLGGKKILVDPVFSGHASPFSFTTHAFPGTDVYGTDDIPPLDYLILTHDHYDHLDYKTVTALRPKVARVITALGVGAHLEKWGYDPAIITELDWNESVALEEGWQLTALLARHFSGRTFKRNQTLWASFVLSTPARKIYIGGDSGYDTHFKNIGERYGPFDLAILECGQYNPYWKYIHMSPEEVVQAAIDLKAQRLLPVHWGKFALALHSWDEPIIRVAAEANIKEMPLAHPLMGEALYFDNMGNGKEWWKGLE